MHTGNIAKLKKYIFLISILFLIVSLVHLIYIYLYSDAKYKPLPGGNISEGLIGEPPNINPLKFQKGNNKYILSFLYRSLVTYDTKNIKIVDDLASCDTSNLLYIECYLKNNLKWSDNTKITTKDIVATYKIIQTTDVNPLLKSLLSDTEIIEKNNVIIFKNTKKNINFLNVLFSPIVNKNILNNIGENELYGNFPTIGGIYSGKYILKNIISNNIQGIIEAILIKNKFYYKNKTYIEKITLKFFKNTSDFLKNKDTVNIFNDKNNILGDSIPRLQSNNYTLPQYVSLLINKDTVKNKNLRSFLLNSINRDNLIKIIGKKFFKPIYNPYISNIRIEQETENKNISGLLSELGYYKKSELLKLFLANSGKKIYSQEVQITKEKTKKLIGTNKHNNKDKREIKNNEKNLSGNKNISKTGSELKFITKEDILKNFGGKSKTITSPNFIDKYNFITKDNILLKGKVTKDINSVYINKNKVGYNSRKKEFFYRLKESENNLSIGENSYKIYFEVNGNKNLQEEIFFIYNPNKGKLNRDKDIFIDSIVKKENDIINQKKADLTNNKKDLKDINIKQFNKINNLDNNLFYDKNYKPFSLKLLYLNSEKNINTTANYIKSSLFQQGISVEIEPISIIKLYKLINNSAKNENNDNNNSGSIINSGSINKDNIDNKLNYDMILLGINLGMFDFNIFPYFHSSQAKNGYNLSHLQHANIDILLEELKGNNLTKDKIRKLEKKVLDILKQNQIIKTLYTPILNNLVDKNIKNYYIPEYIPNKSLRVQSLFNSYILEQKFINLDNKTIKNFIKFLYKIINE